PSTGPASTPARAEAAAPASIKVEQEVPAGDPRGYASIAAWADGLLTGIPDGRPGPIEQAHDLAWYSMRIRGDLDTITLLRPRDTAEWHQLQISLLSGAHLADYYARTLSAAAYRRLFELTGDEMARTIAASHQQGAQEAGAAFWRVVDGPRPSSSGAS